MISSRHMKIVVQDKYTIDKTSRICDMTSLCILKFVDSSFLAFIQKLRAIFSKAILSYEFDCHFSKLYHCIFASETLNFEALIKRIFSLKIFKLKKFLLFLLYGNPQGIFPFAIHVVDLFFNLFDESWIKIYFFNTFIVFTLIRADEIWESCKLFKYLLFKFFTKMIFFQNNFRL